MLNYLLADAVKNNFNIEIIIISRLEDWHTLEGIIETRHL